MTDALRAPTPGSRPKPGANRLLAMLPSKARERVYAAGSLLPLQAKETLFHTGDRMGRVYFPVSGIVSLVVFMEDGRGVDCAALGFEGMVGAPLVLGEEQIQQDAIVQVGGEAWVLSTENFLQLAREDQFLRDSVLGYIGVRLFQATRSAACNRLHSAEQRLARWLLHVEDWTWQERVPVTQDFLSIMLGVRRPTVTVAIDALSGAGAVTHQRGTTTILDRVALEEIACEDYVAIRDAFDRLLSPPGGAHFPGLRARRPA